MRIPQIRAITNKEFVQLMGKCRPPAGWPATIAVANSAGPDSTCLLFLLRRMIDDWNPKTTNTTSTDRDDDLSEAVATDHLPNSILSLHVDHDLQADAKKMANAARTSAHTYKAAQHAELRVPWDVPPFPTRPFAHSGDAIESVARTARYRLMFDAMVRESVYVLATGHHADDQVETVLMRLGSGSSILGLGGMRPLRRVGMALGKVQNDFGWFGHEGLNRWIIRPLLDVPKDRILATCEVHGIQYVLDQTNFQPELTLRNAIRHVLARNEKKRSAELTEPSSEPLPPLLADKITRMKTASEDLKIPVPIDLMASRESLYAAVRGSSRVLSDIESRVSTYLSRFSVQSPPGTFILAADKLSETVTDPLVKLAMILRILRYISPHPWGSTRAQAGRRRVSLERIVQRVWDPDPTSHSRLRFEAGGNVLWTPFRICVDGRLKHEPPLPRRGERFGWLASRSPLSRSGGDDHQLGFDRDVGAEVVLGKNDGRVDVLQDNRFLITFRLDAIPNADPVMASLEEGCGRLMTVLQGRWLWPRVVWRREGEEDVVLARISAPELDWYSPPPGVRRIYSTSEKAQEEPPPWQDAVDFKFIRVLEEP